MFEPPAGCRFLVATPARESLGGDTEWTARVNVRVMKTLFARGTRGRGGSSDPTRAAWLACIPVCVETVVVARLLFVGSQRLGIFGF